MKPEIIQLLVKFVDGSYEDMAHLVTITKLNTQFRHIGQLKHV